MATMLQSILGQRCPRCRKGRLYLHRNPFRFRTIEQMPPACPVCGQDFVIEPGFYFGATYVSYALNVAWLVPTFLFVRFVLGFSMRIYIVVMVLLLPVLVPVFFRLSRAIWLHFFVPYDRSVALRTQDPADAPPAA